MLRHVRLKHLQALCHMILGGAGIVSRQERVTAYPDQVIACPIEQVNQLSAPKIVIKKWSRVYILPLFSKRPPSDEARTKRKVERPCRPISIRWHELRIKEVRDAVHRPWRTTMNKRRRTPALLALAALFVLPGLRADQAKPAALTLEDCVIQAVQAQLGSGRPGLYLSAS